MKVVGFVQDLVGEWVLINGESKRSMSKNDKIVPFDNADEFMSWKELTWLHGKNLCIWALGLTPGGHIMPTYGDPDGVSAFVEEYNSRH